VTLIGHGLDYWQGGQYSPSELFDSPIGVLVCVWAGNVKEQQHFIYFSPEMNSLNLRYQFLNLPIECMCSL
jgi:hypothetical protein